MIAFLSTIECSPSDKELIIQIYEDYNRLMFCVAKRYITDYGACEDVVQDSLEKLIKKIKILRPMERCVLAGYIVSTVRNTAINYLKCEGKTQKYQSSLEESQENEWISGKCSFDELLVLMEQKSTLQMIWPLLSQEDRLLLEGKYILGYTDSELALQLGCKPDSIRMKMTRARRRAFDLMSDRKGECDDETRIIAGTV